MVDEKIDYKKRMKLYEKLGAKKFKKVVMQVEKLRWEITKKFFPNYLDYYEKNCAKKYKKAIKKARTDAEKEQLAIYYQQQILIARKEFNNEKNRNYHIDTKHPNEMIEYLEFNKRVHQQSLVINATLILAASGFVVAGVGAGLAAAFIAVQTILAGKNWQCINLQNYNICRFEAHKEQLKRREEKRQQYSVQNYGEAANVIKEAFDKTQAEARIPTPEEIVAEIKNPEQLRQLKMLLESSKRTYTAVDVANKGKGKK